MESKMRVYTMKEVKENNLILFGKDIFIGKDEKRRNTEVVHIEFPYTVGNYSLFYAGSNEILKKACSAMIKILNHEYKTEKQLAKLYEIIISCLHVTEHRNTEKRKSKLNGLNSLSTCCLDNLFCLERMKKDDCICSHCYSSTQQKTQLALQDRNTINGIILRNILIPVKYWKKYFNKYNLTKFFRIESFGDVQNKTQAINYINFMYAFPRVHFGVWSKNTGIWFFAITETGKPENMVYIVSSENVNKPNNHSFKTFSGIDHVFTVYDKKFIAENGIKINCGGKACMECIKAGKGCYYRNTDFNIAEELK